MAIHWPVGVCCANTVRRKLTDDLRDQGERVSENRIARLASLAGIAAQVGYRRRPGRYGGKPAIVAENRLEQQFQVAAPDQVWVTDITYIKTHEGWLYLCVVKDRRRENDPPDRFLILLHLAPCGWLVGESQKGRPWCIQIKAPNSRAGSGRRSFVSTTSNPP